MAYLASLALADIAATTGYLIVDKSDTTGFPHSSANPIIVKSVRAEVQTEGADAEYNIRIGVLEEVDATDGTTHWFYEARVVGATRFEEHIRYAGEGLSCDTTPGFVGTTNATNTRFQTDVDLINPTGTDTAPGAGDIVAELVEIAGTGSISTTLQVEYVVQR